MTGALASQPSAPRSAVIAVPDSPDRTGDRPLRNLSDGADQGDGHVTGDGRTVMPSPRRLATTDALGFRSTEVVA